MLRFLFMILTVFVSLLWPLAAQASAFGDQVADMAEVKAVRIGSSEDLRQAVTLREIEGLSYEEIAAAMNCPIGTVRSRIFRARESIDAKLHPLLH